MKTFSRTMMLAMAMGIASPAISTSAMAGNAGASLGDCYNHVISACNKKKNVDAAHACANSGMNACDKEHRASMSEIPGATLKAMRSATLRKAAPRAVVTR